MKSGIFILVALVSLLGASSAANSTIIQTTCTKNEKVFTCSGRDGGNFADFTNKSCGMADTTVTRACLKRVESIEYTEFTAQEFCNKNTVDNWRGNGWAGCYNDQETASAICRTAGYQRMESFWGGKYKSPGNNGISKWEGTHFVIEPARNRNALLKGVKCVREVEI